MMVYSDGMTSLIRIQIQLTDAQAAFLKMRSLQEERSVADLVREAVDGLMREDQGVAVEARRAASVLQRSGRSPRTCYQLPRSNGSHPSSTRRRHQPPFW